MSLLFTQAWDIVRGKEEQYTEFVANTFIPKCNELGLRAVGGYYVQVGIGPRIISVKSVETLEELYKALANSNFKKLKEKLRNYTVNYSSKVLAPTGKAKNGPYTIQKGVWKFNQYWDVLPDMRSAYSDYIENTYLPTLEKIDYVEVTGGWNVLIGGFSEVVSELTFEDPVDIGRLLGDESFREMIYTLQTEYVTNHKSRVLRTTERFDEPRWFRL